MKKKAKDILADLKSDDSKERVMFYLDSDLQEEFKSACLKHKVRMSAVVEKLIRSFLDEIKEEKGKK